MNGIAGTDARIAELKAAISALWNDRDDATVMSEIVMLVGELRRAEKRLVRQ